MYYTFVGILFFIGLAMTVQQGLWNNLISLFSIVLGGLIAFGVHQPLVIWADNQTGGSYTYLLDFPILWGVFAVATGLLKELAALLSKTQVSFPDQVNTYGGVAVGAMSAYALTAFSMATLHVAPLSYDQFGGMYEYGLKPSEVESNLASASTLTRPDVAWLRVAESVLRPDAFGSAGFSTKIFVSQQSQHRKTFQDMDESIVKRG